MLGREKSSQYRAFGSVSFLVLGFLASANVDAHGGEAVARFGSFLGGVTHPVLGIDHLIAMLSVGIVSAQIGGRAIWIVPLCFVAMMGVGGALGMLDINVPAIEVGIALSVLFLGFIIAAEKSLPLSIAMACVGIFAIFHGHAHGSEMPAAAIPIRYALGFTTGTALIHIAGVFIGNIPGHYQRGPFILRCLGGVIAISGAVFVLNIF